MSDVFTQAADKMQQLLSTGGKAIMITGPMIRRHIRAFFEPVHPSLVVLSYSELLPDIVINSVGSIGFESYD